MMKTAPAIRLPRERRGSYSDDADRQGQRELVTPSHELKLMGFRLSGFQAALRQVPGKASQYACRNAIIQVSVLLFTPPP